MERWREIARIAIREFGGTLTEAVKRPLKEAKKALQRFPNIWEPGATKILLFSKAHVVLGLESNGLRVLRGPLIAPIVAPAREGALQNQRADLPEMCAGRRMRLRQGSREAEKPR